MQTLREAAQRGGRPSADVAGAEGAGGHLHAVAGALGALGMDTLKEFEARSAASADCTRPAVVPLLLVRCCASQLAAELAWSAASCNTCCATMQDQLSSCMGMYVEEVLSGHFQLLLSHVQKAEHARKAQASS